jgi:hypothetical protein
MASTRLSSTWRIAIVATGFALLPAFAQATPSTTYWAPSTATCQAKGVPHVTYDTYFTASGNYPIDTGITIGVLPGDKVQAEFGYDLLMPGKDPAQFYLNGKVCVTENTLFKGGPAVSFGFYNIGFEKDKTDYNPYHLMFQKSLPWGGYVAAGLYHGLSTPLFTNSDGDVAKTGAMIGATTPDIKVGIKGLDKIIIAGDIQTGKNIFGAGGFGAYFFFNERVSLLVGPVFFVDKALQPGGASYMWTTQLDVDIPLGK